MIPMILTSCARCGGRCGSTLPVGAPAVLWLEGDRDVTVVCPACADAVLAPKLPRPAPSRLRGGLVAGA